jgi:hypothetical protein
MANKLKSLIVGTVASLLGGLALHAADTETQPFPGVRYVQRHTTEPREIDMHIVFVDLKRRGVTITTTEPNGDKPGETNLKTTRAFVTRSKAQIGMTDFLPGDGTTACVRPRASLEPDLQLLRPRPDLVAQRRRLHLGEPGLDLLGTEHRLRGRGG